MGERLKKIGRIGVGVGGWGLGMGFKNRFVLRNWARIWEWLGHVSKPNDQVLDGVIGVRSFMVSNS